MCHIDDRTNLFVFPFLVGDIPLAIQVPNSAGDAKPRFVVCADTSYSGDTNWMGDGRKNLGRGNALSGRGDVAVTELLMEQCTESDRIKSIKCHGKLSDGSPYQSMNYLEDSKDGDDSYIGKLVDRNKFIFDGSEQDDSSDDLDWWIKTRFSDGKYLVSSSKGYDVFNSIASEREAEVIDAPVLCPDI